MHPSTQPYAQQRTSHPRLQAPAGGFTLIELMIVVAVIGVLAGIAYPAYTRHIQRAYRAEARAVLLEAAQYMERYYAAKASYANATLPARLQVAPAGADAAGTRYTLTVTADATSFTLRATPQSADDCGALTINQLGVRAALSPASGMTAESCWR